MLCPFCMLLVGAVDLLLLVGADVSVRVLWISVHGRRQSVARSWCHPGFSMGIILAS